jgi:hypothetical protein
LRSEFKEVDAFRRNQKQWLVVRILINDILGDNNWELGSLISYESYDYLLFEYEGEHEINN